MQLSYYFNDLEFSRQHTCWIEQLDSTSRNAIDVATAGLLNDLEFAENWRNATDDNRYPLRGLTDISAFPDGLQLCYPQGTDVRVPTTN